MERSASIRPTDAVQLEVQAAQPCRASSDVGSALSSSSVRDFAFKLSACAFVLESGPVVLESGVARKWGQIFNLVLLLMIKQILQLHACSEASLLKLPTFRTNGSVT